MSSKQEFIIEDWAGNVCFNGQVFTSFEEADAFLDTYLNEHDPDPEARGEYYVEELT